MNDDIMEYTIIDDQIDLKELNMKELNVITQQDRAILNDTIYKKYKDTISIVGFGTAAYATVKCVFGLF